MSHIYRLTLWIRGLALEMFPDAQRILDFFHLCENFHAYAGWLFSGDEDK
ncbi:MAG: hypothetical protein LBU32_10240 [Clostridiales bacterium]|nr:hypothetical protein [Clostridiales bacterium]